MPVCECGNETCFEQRKFGLSCAHCWKVIEPITESTTHFEGDGCGPYKATPTISNDWKVIGPGIDQELTDTYDGPSGDICDKPHYYLNIAFAEGVKSKQAELDAVKANRGQVKMNGVAWAVEKLKEGKPIRRKDWPVESNYIKFKNQIEEYVGGDYHGRYAPSQNDLMSNDWVLFEQTS